MELDKQVFGKIGLIVLFSCFSTGLFGQVDSVYTQRYLERSTKFAWLTYGGDLNLSTGGVTQIRNTGNLQNLSFGHRLVPRLTIGGVHFWGHADFYVTFPLNFASLDEPPGEFESLDASEGIETGLRIYPWKLTSGKVRPFTGISFRGIRFSQEEVNSGSGNGVAEFGRFVYPLQFGLTYSGNSSMVSASIYYIGENEFDYYAYPNEQVEVRLNPVSFNFSFLKYLDLDAGARRSGMALRFNQKYADLEERKRLSTWYLSAGPSAALQQSKSPFLTENFEFFEDQYFSAILPDLGLGYYFHKPDLNIGLTYRGYRGTYEGFDNEIRVSRQSIGLESIKFLFNYLGFVPFIGGSLTYESLSTEVNGVMYSEQKPALGIVFGWDIRVVNTEKSLLRTNLRYYPNLNMKVNGDRIMFDHLEFNFIQYVRFIGR